MLSALGPITAMVRIFDLSSGRRPFSFFSRTMDFTAASKASRRWSSASFSSYGISARGTMDGGSNIPSLNRVVRTLITARVIVSSETRPSSTASFRAV